MFISSCSFYYYLHIHRCLLFNRISLFELYMCFVQGFCKGQGPCFQITLTILAQGVNRGKQENQFVILHVVSGGLAATILSNTACLVKGIAKLGLNQLFFPQYVYYLSMFSYFLLFIFTCIYVLLCNNINVLLGKELYLQSNLNLLRRT